MRKRLTDQAVKAAKPADSTAIIWDELLTGFGLRINAGGRKSFVVKGRADGRQYMKTVGDATRMPLAAARDKARALIAEGPEHVPGLLSFEHVADRFRREHLSTLKTGRKQGHELARLAEAFSGREIGTIRKAEIRAYLDHRAEAGQVAANRSLALIRKLFNWCAETDLIEASPVVSIKPAKEAPRERVLTSDEMRRIWQASISYPFGPAIRLLMVTGQRRQEVGGMRWPEIDGELWTIPGERTKSGRSHEVPLSNLAIETVEGLPRITDQSFLFSTTGRTPISGWSKAKAQLDAATGIEGWRFHDIRRSVASSMARLQIDRLTISRVLGHAEGGITGPVYIRYGYLEEKAQALQRWADELAWMVNQ